MPIKRLPLVLLLAVAVLLPAWAVPGAESPITPELGGEDTPSWRVTRGKLGP